MNKVGIVSLYGNNNYGNKLQNYAVQETIKKYGYEVENIINIPCLNNRENNKKEIIKYFTKAYLKKLFFGIEIHSCVDKNDSKEKQNAYLEFNKYINNSKHFFSFKNLSKYEEYDAFFVGSDQVWNPIYGGLSDLDLLTFTNKKKIAVSASFGIDKIPVNYVEKVKKYLNEFDGISVRENKGREIIGAMLPNKEVEVLVDPTMLLSNNEWNVVAKRPKNYDDKEYILCYFLGPISPNRKKKINDFAKKRNLEVINLLDPMCKYKDIGPSEFIYLESHASLILTDSFHSSVFAILYNIPFIVYDREGKHNNMNSRIVTLLEKFELSERKYNEQINFEEMMNVDYQNSYKILENERKKYKHFLNKCLRGI
ncbi:MAG: polysaccharide pyruvyl transferase family protein [Clostridium saudiense]|uniref:polysaccharide pyruvyl transferase family protein n=1 Tax=Clostridium saudiense TaxID=1414720 RepID=UPI0029087205|nr:polysaccharide pyruvyl transferase family protein [Clostridium saudiense]MDU3520893.1 polysaccharide pyruvyl transferase family protein [Clostridium saudiense]